MTMKNTEAHFFSQVAIFFFKENIVKIDNSTKLSLIFQEINVPDFYLTSFPLFSRPDANPVKYNFTKRNVVIVC